MSSDESKEEQLDRELIELLNELRVALPGVQVLFAFLLGVPFTQRFGQVCDMLFDAPSAAVVAALTAAFFGWFWYGLPLLRRSRLER